MLYYVKASPLWNLKMSFVKRVQRAMHRWFAWGATKSRAKSFLKRLSASSLKRENIAKYRGACVRTPAAHRIVSVYVC